MDRVPCEILQLGATALLSIRTMFAAGASSIFKPEGATRRMEEPQRAGVTSGPASFCDTTHIFPHRGTKPCPPSRRAFAWQKPPNLGFDPRTRLGVDGT